LIEVIIAVSILAMGLVGASFLLTSAFGTYRHQGQTMEVFHVTHDRMEYLTGSSYDVLRQKVAGARRPEDKTAKGVAPDEDFVTAAAGDVSTHYRMVPEGPDSDVYKVETDDVRGHIYLTGQRPNGEIEATMRLQYWDPVFDAPSQTDKGLIRANFQIKGFNLNDKSTKYFTR
jgi:hypothetical protein